MPRKYELRKRAEHQEKTLQRIVEATVELHETLGPAKTTISAVAEGAGVDRSTVYRYFPDEHSLFRACTSHYIAKNPPPDPTAWWGIDDAETRLRIALTEIYAYHGRTEQMVEKTARDLPELPAMREALVPYFEHWATIREALIANWKIEKECRERLIAAVGHAVDFQTWRSLVREQGLDDLHAVELMVCMVRCSSRCLEMGHGISRGCG
jgi:AcrR family transcriptional regulator